MPAARYAAQRGETLIHGEALLDAREAMATRPDFDHDDLRATLNSTTTPTGAVVANSTLVALIDDVVRLRLLEADRITLLERLAFEEAQRHDPALKYPLRRIADDTYLPWSGSSDSPVAAGLLTRADALARGWLPTHLDQADARDADAGDVLYNRAGPGETCLTRAALAEAFANAQAYREFRLTPDKVQPLTTSDMRQNDAGEWEHSETYWTPWAPDEQPDTLPDGWRDRY